MILPVLLVFFAILAAALFAFGTEPLLASYGPRGLELILWAQRFQWPLILLSLLFCIALGVAVISKKTRVWWLVGLVPVLFLFYHKYTAGPASGFYCVQDPHLVSFGDAKLDPNELVIGLVLDSQPYAFSYPSMHQSPVVVASVRDKRLAVFWSEYANRALAFTTTRDFRADDLQVVCNPDNALLVYNSRLGQFINGVTGQTPSGETPSGLLESIPVLKTNWQSWVMLHPDTLALISGNSGPFTQPTPPRYAMPGTDPSLSDTSHVCVVATTQPIAVPSEAITQRPLNLTSGQSSLLLVRLDGVVHAFNRELPGDLIPRFAPGSDPKHKNVAWVDSDTNSGWTATGQQVTGPPDTHGLSLTPISVEDDLYWNVMKFWYPPLHLATPSELAAATVVKSAKPAAAKSEGKRHRARKLQN